jgi:hypothetical protein
MDITFWIFFFLQIYLINFKLDLIIIFKNSKKNEKLECMEYICNKIIIVIEFEKIAHIFQN